MSYEPKLVVDQRSDQGPWGGQRTILWHAPTADTFKEDAVVAFAKQQGWNCAPGLRYSAQQMEAWTGRRSEKVFPLMDEAGVVRSATAWFPRRIDRDSVVLRCESGFTLVDPGTAATRPAYGYVHISLDGRDLAIYHAWGE